MSDASASRNETRLHLVAPAGERSGEGSVREQLIAAAEVHFARYGYAKTTLVDLARAVGFSKTYFYRFFASKQEIGEEICALYLGRILEEVVAQSGTARNATDRLRKILRVAAERMKALCFEERQLFDIAMASRAEGWASSRRYGQQLRDLIEATIAEGRATGEFERKTPADEAARAIMLAMQPFMDPLALQHNLDAIPDGCNAVISLILRSLAP